MQRKKKIAIAAVCAVLAVLLVAGLFGGAFLVLRGIKNAQLGGLVGELLGGSGQRPGLFPDDTDQVGQEHLTEDAPYEDPYKPVFFFDAAHILRYSYQKGTLAQDDAYVSFEYLADWQPYDAQLIPMNATFRDVRYIVIRYRANDECSGRFSLQARDALQGAPDIKRLDIQYDGDGAWHSLILDITDLFSENPHHYLSALDLCILSNASYYQRVDIAYVAGFSSSEAADAYFDPVYVADAEHLASAISQFSKAGVADARYNPPIPGDGASLTVRPVGGYDHPYFTVCQPNGTTYSQGGRYLAIKCRKRGPDIAQIYVSSRSTPGIVDECVPYTVQYTDIDWQLLIIDLSECSTIHNSYDIESLRFDFFAEPAQSYDFFEIGYIATFRSVAAARQYDADHSYARG